MASTKLRLLIDESVTEPLASSIMKLAPSAILSRKTVGQGAEDSTVAMFANKERRTIVAIDSDFKRLRVEWGVIKINSPDRADDACLFAIFRTFWQSGLRAKSRKNRTSLTNDGVTIKNSVKISHSWHPKPCPHRMSPN